MVALADLATYQRCHQSPDQDSGQRDEPASCQLILGDRDGRQVDAVEDVVLLAEYIAEPDGEERHHQPDQPNPEPLPSTVVARHAAGDIAAGVVGDHQDHEDRDRGGQPERPRVPFRVRAAELERLTHGRRDCTDDARQQNRHRDGNQPAEEVGADVEPPELLAPLLLRLSMLRHEWSRRHARVLLVAIGYAVTVSVGGGGAGGGAPLVAVRYAVTVSILRGRQLTSAVVVGRGGPRVVRPVLRRWP